MCKKLIVLASLILVLGSTAQAGVYLWNGSAGDGLWETPANWTVTDSVWTWPNEEYGNRQVNSDTIAIDILNGDAVTRGSDLGIDGAADGSTTGVLTLDNGSSLTVASGALSTSTDPSRRGQIDVLGGSLVTIVSDGNDIRIADDPDTWGMMNIVDSTVNIADDLRIDEGEGYVNISGSSTINADDIIVGDNATGVGYLDISGTATINVDDLKTDDGEGHITVGGNATLNLDDLFISDKPTGLGFLAVSGAATINIADDLGIEEGTGTVNIGGDSTVTVGDVLYVSHDTGEGRLNISDNATVNILDDLIVANTIGTIGYLHISGNPTINITEQFYMNDDGPDEGMPMVPSNSQVIMDGGTVIVGSYTTFNDDNNGTAEFIMNGGSFYSADYLNLSDNLDGTAHLTMNGGEMITGNRLRLGKDGGEDIGQVRIFMNGGLLQAEELDIKMTDTKIIYTGGEFRIGSASLDEAGMQQLIDDGTIVAEGAYSITTDGDYTVLQSPSATKIDIRITAGNDDGEDHIAYGDQPDDGAESRGSTDLEMPWEGGVGSSSLQVIGLRFTDIPIPKGTTIVSAYVQFTGDNDDDDKLVGGPVNLIINGLLQPNPDGLGGGENFYTDRNPKTTSEVNWTDIPEWSNGQATPESRTPDISSILTEIINQDDWVGGNALMLFFRDDEANPSAATRSALSSNESAAVAPLLHLEVIIDVATQPYPTDGAEGVPVGTSLAWNPSSTAVSHDVYFGTSSPPAFVGSQNANTYYPGPIEPATTYYWRIDEVTADGTALTGDVWSFTTGLGNIGIDKPIAAGNDDGEDHIAYGAQTDDGAESRGSSDLEMPWEGGVGSSSFQVIGLRFTDLSIPKGVLIAEAYVQFTGDNDDDDKLVGGPVNLIINGLLQPNPDGLGSGENFYTDRNPKTLAEVKWTDIPEWSNGQATSASKTPDITSVIEEIINQDGWAIGNALMLFVRDDETNPSAATRSALSGDEGAGVAPLLHIAGISEVATQPHPADGAVDVPLDAVLSWWPGFSAVSHIGYIGTSSPPPLLGDTKEVSYDPGGLQPSTTYYWQIDAVTADGIVYPGDIWSFTTVTGSATQPAPADGALVVETSATLSWVAGVTAASHDVYIGESFDSVDSGAEGTFAGNQAATTLDVGLPGGPLADGLVRGTTYYWRVDEVEADGTTVYKGDIWSFTIEPFTAYNPSPADGATGVDTNVELSWTPGYDAKLHSVYFGDDLDTVSNAVGAPPMPFVTFNPGPLEAGKTYYWRIDEFNPPITSKGEVWSFTTAP